MPKQQSNVKSHSQLQTLRTKLASQRQQSVGGSGGGGNGKKQLQIGKGGINAADLSTKNRRLAKELNEFKGKRECAMERVHSKRTLQL